MKRCASSASSTALTAGFSDSPAGPGWLSTGSPPRSGRLGGERPRRARSEQPLPELPELVERLSGGTRPTCRGGTGTPRSQLLFTPTTSCVRSGFPVRHGGRLATAGPSVYSFDERMALIWSRERTAGRWSSRSRSSRVLPPRGGCGITTSTPPCLLWTSIWADHHFRHSLWTWHASEILQRGRKEEIIRMKIRDYVHETEFKKRS